MQSASTLNSDIVPDEELIDLLDNLQETSVSPHTKTTVLKRNYQDHWPGTRNVEL